jgi:hypothetical protein
MYFGNYIPLISMVSNVIGLHYKITSRNSRKQMILHLRIMHCVSDLSSRVPRVWVHTALRGQNFGSSPLGEQRAMAYSGRVGDLMQLIEEL